MRKIVRKTVVFQCGVCKVEHKTMKEAIECEGRTLEEKKFKLGDKVRGREKHNCDHGQIEKNFLPRGYVIEIYGPELMDEEYSNKWLGGGLLYCHVYQYRVEYECLCGKVRQYQFYSPELKLDKSNKIT